MTELSLPPDITTNQWPETGVHPSPIPPTVDAKLSPGGEGSVRRSLIADTAARHTAGRAFLFGRRHNRFVITAPALQETGRGI